MRSPLQWVRGFISGWAWMRSVLVDTLKINDLLLISRDRELSPQERQYCEEMTRGYAKR